MGNFGLRSFLNQISNFEKPIKMLSNSTTLMRLAFDVYLQVIYMRIDHILTIGYSQVPPKNIRGINCQNLSLIQKNIRLFDAIIYELNFY
jgi:hypothetical protein